MQPCTHLRSRCVTGFVHPGAHRRFGEIEVGATWPILLPPSRTNCTTSALYSGVNIRRGLAIRNTSVGDIIASSHVSTKPGEVHYVLRLGIPKRSRPLVMR